MTVKAGNVVGTDGTPPHCHGFGSKWVDNSESVLCYSITFSVVDPKLLEGSGKIITDPSSSGSEMNLK